MSFKRCSLKLLLLSIRSPYHDNKSPILLNAVLVIEPLPPVFNVISRLGSKFRMSFVLTVGHAPTLRQELRLYTSQLPLLLFALNLNCNSLYFVQRIRDTSGWPSKAMITLSVITEFLSIIFTYKIYLLIWFITAFVTLLISTPLYD